MAPCAIMVHLLEQAPLRQRPAPKTVMLVAAVPLARHLEVDRAPRKSHLCGAP